MGRPAGGERDGLRLGVATRTPRPFGQYSGLARALERVGERWALLIVRDLLVGARRYGDLKGGLPRIPTNILSDRLRELQEAGIVRRVPMVRGGYELTDLGRALEPAILALERWGWSTLGDPGEGESVSHDAVAASLRAAFRAESAASLPDTAFALHIDEVSLVATVSGPRLFIRAVGRGAVPAPRIPAESVAPAESVEVAFGPTVLRDLLTGVTTPAAALASRAADLRSGYRRVFERFPEVFRIEPVGGSHTEESEDRAA